MRVALVACGVFLYPLVPDAAQSQTAANAPRPSVSVSEDAGTWRRDPFIGNLKKDVKAAAVKGILLKSGTGVPKSGQEQDFQLQGIMQTDMKFHALINGRSVKAGDTISGVTIKQISRHQVIVFNERKEKIIYDIYQGRIDRGKQ